MNSVLLEWLVLKFWCLIVGQMDSKNSRVTFAIKIIFWRTFVIITSSCNVIRDNTKLEGQVRGIGQSSPASLHQIWISNWTPLKPVLYWSLTKCILEQNFGLKRPYGYFIQILLHAKGSYLRDINPPSHPTAPSSILARNIMIIAVSYTHLTLPTICSV